MMKRKPSLFAPNATRACPVDCLQLQGQMPETQTHFRSIVTDPYCRALGSNGTIYTIGDCATVEQVASVPALSDFLNLALS